MTRNDERRAALFADFIASRSERTRNEIVESFAPLAEYFAGRYRDRGLESEDLRQVAQLALVRAVDRFDPTFGVSFSTFAGRTIDGELKRHFRDRAWAVRVPRRLQEESAVVRNSRDDLQTTLGRAPTVDEIAEHSGLDPDAVLEALDAHQAFRAESLDRPTSDDGGDAPVSRLMGEVDRGFDRTTSRLAIEQMVAELPEREQTIIRLRFFEHMSQSEIAEQIGVSQMHVSRLLRRTLDQLRSLLDEERA